MTGKKAQRDPYLRPAVGFSREQLIDEHDLYLDLKGGRVAVRLEGRVAADRYVRLRDVAEGKCDRILDDRAVVLLHALLLETKELTADNLQQLVRSGTGRGPERFGPSEAKRNVLDRLRSSSKQRKEFEDEGLAAKACAVVNALIDGTNKTLSIVLNSGYAILLEDQRGSLFSSQARYWEGPTAESKEAHTRRWEFVRWCVYLERVKPSPVSPLSDVFEAATVVVTVANQSRLDRLVVDGAVLALGGGVLLPDFNLFPEYYQVLLPPYESPREPPPSGIVAPGELGSFLWRFRVAGHDVEELHLENLQIKHRFIKV